MDTPSKKQVRILRGCVTVGQVKAGPGNVVSVDEGLLSWLEKKRSAILRFEVVEGETPDGGPDRSPSGGDVPPPPPSNDGATGDDHDEDDTDTHTGEGETVGDGDEEQDGQAATVPAGEVSPSSSVPYTLQALDARVTGALVAAGWDTLEKLKGATVDELVKVPGIGKARAAAILDEVRGA